MAARRREVRWSRAAEGDLLEIAEFIREDRPAAAPDILASLRSRVGSLAAMAERGRIVPELARLGIRVYRETLVPPWRIMYRLSARPADIVAILDARRNVEDLLWARLTRERR